LRSRKPNTSFQTVARIAYAVGVPLGWLLEEEGFELSPLQIGEVEQLIVFLRNAIDRTDTSELLRLRRFLDDDTITAPHSEVRRETEEEYTWRVVIHRMRRETFRDRIVKLLPMLSVFRNGRLAVAAGSMLYVRTADDKQFHIGRCTPDRAGARASLHARSRLSRATRHPYRRRSAGLERTVATRLPRRPQEDGAGDYRRGRARASRSLHRHANTHGS